MTIQNKPFDYVRFLLLLVLPLLAACEDDFNYYDPVHIGEGESLVSASVAFKDFGETDLSSRAAGDVMKQIKTLHVLVYDADENLVLCKNKIDFTISKETNNDRPDEGNFDGGTSAERNTPIATFNMKLNYGKYHIYAIANVDNLYDEWGDTTNYNTVDKLLKLRVAWKHGEQNNSYVDRTSENAQMFGYFCDTANKYGINDASSFRSPEVVVINKPSLKIRAWVRRLASKMTVAFDTRKLKDNVYIYIKSISLKDIPDSCVLGEDNKPKDYSKDLIHGYDPQEYVLPDDPAYDKDFIRPINNQTETFYFGQAAESDTDPKASYSKWRCLTAGDSIFGYYSDKHGIQSGSIEERLKKEHAETVDALFFYENMQGIGKNKFQDANNDNNIDYPNPDINEDGTGWKDHMKCGTYMEVEAYYISEDSVRPGRGPIKYRFMLGQNTTTDYNARRNHHYKLTLQFLGYANDIDWHIDYEEEDRPGFMMPDTVYVSYLYNQPHSFAGRLTPDKGYKLESVEGVILKNEWRAYVPDLDNHENLTIKDEVNEASVNGLYNAKSWNMQIKKEGYFKDYGGISTYDTADDDPDREKNAPNCAFGFLSLRKVDKVIININDWNGALEQNTKDLRKNYFNGATNGKGGSLGQRIYDIPQSSNICGDENNGKYNVMVEKRQSGETDYIVMFPLYTRANTIGTWSVYSGANPFYTHERKAYVRYIATYKNDEGKTYSDTAYTTVMQTNRLDNPRGIIRKHNSRDPFMVTLMENLPTGQQHNGVVFAPFESHGAWSATIQRDPYGLVRLVKGSQVVTGEGGRITGKTGTNIEFTYIPNRILEKEDMAIGAIIEVKYHNNSCIHKIIVRQGYGPVQFDKSGVTWSSFNVYDSNHVTKSPLAVGSLFRRATNLDYPIAESNNAKWGIGECPDGKLEIVGKDPMEWKTITTGILGYENANNAAFVEFEDNDNKHKYRAPNQNEVLTSGNQFNPNVNYAFGLVYGEGAGKTLNTSGAYSYSDYKNEGKDDERGARGVIAYCLKHGDNVFFPFGQYGHGRRKGRDNSDNKNKYGGGVLRYGSLDYKLTGNENDWDFYRPLAYNLPAQYGAAYWFGGSGEGKISLDFNAGNYMVSALSRDDLYTWGDEKYEPLPWPNPNKIYTLPDALPIKPIRLDP